MLVGVLVKVGVRVGSGVWVGVRVLVGVLVGTRVDVGVCVGDGATGVCVGIGKAVGVLVAICVSGVGVAVSSGTLSSVGRRAGFRSSGTPELMQPCINISKAQNATRGVVLLATMVPLN